MIEERAGGALAELVDAGCCHAFTLLCVHCHYSSLSVAAEALLHFTSKTYIVLQRNCGERRSSSPSHHLNNHQHTHHYHHNHNLSSQPRAKNHHHNRSKCNRHSQAQVEPSSSLIPQKHQPTATPSQPFFLKANVRRRPSTRRNVDFTHCHVKSLTKQMCTRTQLWR